MAINIFNFRKTPTPASVNPNNGRGATNLFADEKTAYDKMLSDGISQDMANKVITERRKTLLGEITPKESLALQKMMADGIDSKIAARAVTQNRYNKASVGQKIAKNVLDMGASGTALIAEQQANIGSLLTGSDKLRQTAQNIRDIRKNDFESTIGGKIGSTTIGAGEMTAVGPTKIAPSIWGRIGQGAVEGLITGTATPLLEKGKDVTAGEVATSAGLNTALGALAVPVVEKGLIPLVGKTVQYGQAGLKGKLLKTVGQDIVGAGQKLKQGFQKGAKNTSAEIALGGIINPAKLDAVKKGLMVEEGIATPQDVGNWMLNRVKPGNKQQIAEQLLEHSNKSKQAVDEALGTIPNTFENPSANISAQKIADDLGDSLSPELQAQAKRMQELANKSKLTLTEQQEIKRAVDARYKVYKQSKEVRDTKAAQDLNYLRQNIRKFIEDEAGKYGVDIKALNNETSVARGLAEGILKKDNSDAVRELLTAFAPSGFGSAIGASQSIARGEDPLTVIRDAVIGGVVAKGLTSTRLRTTIASKINNLGPKEMSALTKYIQSGGKDAIGKKVASEIVNTSITDTRRLLPAGKPQAVVTPQTVDRGIIQESKIPLKNTKYGRNNTPSMNTDDNNILLNSNKTNKPTNKPAPKDMPIETDTPITNAIETGKGSNLKNTLKGNDDVADYIDNLIENSNGKTSKEIAEKVQRVIYNKGIKLTTLDAEHISKYIDEFMTGKTNKKLGDIIRGKGPDEPPPLGGTKLKPTPNQKPTPAVSNKTEGETPLISNKPKNAIPNQTTKISSKDGNVTKTDATITGNIKNDIKKPIPNKENGLVNKDKYDEVLKSVPESAFKGSYENMFRIKKEHGILDYKKIGTDYYIYDVKEGWQILEHNGHKFRQDSFNPTEKIKILESKLKELEGGLNDKGIYNTKNDYNKIKEELDFFNKYKYNKFQNLERDIDYYIKDLNKYANNKKVLNIVEEQFDEKLAKYYNTNNPTKIEEIKQILKKVLPSNFKEKAQDLVDKTMEKIGGKTNLMGNEGIGADKTALLKGSDDLISEARNKKEIEDIKKVAKDIFGDEFRLFQAKKPISQIEEIARDDYWEKPEIIKKVNQIKERILKGEELPPLIADRRIGDKTTPYSIVDGLHRMKALEELGYKGDVEIIYPLGKKISSDSLFYKEPYMQKIDLKQIYEQSKPKLLKK